MPAKHNANSYTCSLCGTVYRDSRTQTAFQRASECEAKDRHNAEMVEWSRTPYERDGQPTRANLAEVKYVPEVVIFRDIMRAFSADPMRACEVQSVDTITNTMTVILNGEKYSLHAARVENENPS